MVSNCTSNTTLFYKETDSHSYLRYDSSHPKACRNSIPYSQLLRLRHICSDDSDFLNKTNDMCAFFRNCGFLDTILREAQLRVSTINRKDALYKTKTQNTNNGFPLVLTYHPMTKKVQHIIQRNFSILQDDPSTAPIFINPPVMSYRRDKNQREHLVHSNTQPNLDSLKGMFPCNRSHCATCKYIHSNTVGKEAKSSFTIHDTFTCISKGIIHCIGCIKCNKLYIGETKQRLADHFVEHLKSIRINTLPLYELTALPFLSPDILTEMTTCDREREDLSCKSPSRPKRALSRGTCTPVQRRVGLERGAEKEVGHLGAGK
ncbi:UNVERIFIED_CONTAM: hypothetical protein FKN15_054267 [Acipenser sinensis]